MTEVNPTFAWAIMSSGGLLAADTCGHAHVYNTEEQATASLMGNPDLDGMTVGFVAVVPVAEGGDDEI